MNLNQSLSKLPKHPLSLFQSWFSNALDNFNNTRKAFQDLSVPEDKIHEVLRFESVWAMNLATCNKEGRVSNRMVLYKGLSKGKDFSDGAEILDEGYNSGICFFSHWDSSRKAMDLKENDGKCSLCFYWTTLGRQIRIEGVAHKLSKEESDKYWLSRSVASRKGAVVSKQSQILTDRDAFKRLCEEEGSYEIRPDHWGGYSVVPDRIEFWENGADRIHDRVIYEKQEDGEWKQYRIYP